jgi:hypothetical protein
MEQGNTALQAADQHDLVPKEVFGVELEQGPKVSKMLRTIMEKKEKKIFFNGKEYAEFSDLQVISDFFGLSVRTHDAQPVEIHGVKGFKAHADLVNANGIVVGGAEAYCMADEPNWSRKPLFQLASMAQTRAASKSISNRYRWVVAMAGYGTTPAEEMTAETSHSAPQPQQMAYTPKGFPEEATIQAMEIKERTSKKGSKYWSVLDVEGIKYFTFSEKVAKSLMDAKQNDSMSLVKVEKTEHGNKLVD